MGEGAVQVRYEDVVKALVEILSTVGAPATGFVIYAAEDVVKTFEKRFGLKVSKTSCEPRDNNVALKLCLGKLPDGRHIHIIIKRFLDEKGRELNAKITFAVTVPEEGLKRWMA